jgi:dihydroneopterin aldolase
MKIHIDNLEIECIIGLLDLEREHTQRVCLDIQVDYLYIIGQFLDYSQMVEQVTSHLQSQRYELLEDALEGIKTLLFQTFENIENLQIKLSKPDILPNCLVALSQSWKKQSNQ